MCHLLLCQQARVSQLMLGIGSDLDQDLSRDFVSCLSWHLFVLPLLVIAAICCEIDRFIFLKTDEC